MLHVRVVTDLAALQAQVGAWQELARDAAEPNPFYEPWMLLPALQAFGRGADLRFLFLYEGRALVGFIPLERAWLYRRVPLPHRRLWKYPHCYLGTPLVRRGYAPQCLQALAEWLEHDIVYWREVGADGPFAVALDEAAGRLRLSPYRRGRAVLRRRRDADAYLAEALPGPSRKELRRLARRLAEQGKLGVRGGFDADAFLRLEAAGWKGRNASAFASSRAAEVFFRRMMSAAQREGRLMTLALELDGQPVALKCNLLAGEGAFAFKIAYDERYARFSPGLLLEVENIRVFHASTLEWMDSCAEPEHFMMNRLWLDRRPLVDLVAATGRREFLMSSLSLLQRLWRGRRTAAPASAVT